MDLKSCEYAPGRIDFLGLRKVQGESWRWLILSGGESRRNRRPL